MYQFQIKPLKRHQKLGTLFQQASMVLQVLKDISSFIVSKEFDELKI